GRWEGGDRAAQGAARKTGRAGEPFDPDAAAFRQRGKRTEGGRGEEGSGCSITQSPNNPITQQPDHPIRGDRRRAAKRQPGGADASSEGRSGGEERADREGRLQSALRYEIRQRKNATDCNGPSYYRCGVRGDGRPPCPPPHSDGRPGQRRGASPERPVA